MFIAKCGGEVARRTNQMHLNNGDGTFTENGAAIGLADPMQTWSSAWGDFDNDGDMDVFVGASSGAHKLMRNNGPGAGYTFTDVTAASGVLSVTATGIENATYDFNNDGFLDIASNGNILYGNGDLTFTTIDFGAISGSNGAFGDLNNDGFVDAFNSGFIRLNSGNDNHWLVINTVGDPSNINGIGARIELTTDSGTQIRDVRNGEGFRFLSTLNTHFGTGADTNINTLVVKWPSGTVDTFEDVAVDQVVTIYEGQPLSVEEQTNEVALTVYPNPATEILQLDYRTPLTDAQYTIYNLNGALVQSGVVANKSINVAALASGAYVVKIETGGAVINKQFLKQ